MATTRAADSANRDSPPALRATLADLIDAHERAAARSHFTATASKSREEIRDLHARAAEAEASLIDALTRHGHMGPVHHRGKRWWVRNHGTFGTDDNWRPALVCEDIGPDAAEITLP